MHNDIGFFDTLHDNAREYIHYYNWIKNIAISSFDYCLPDTINVRFMETTLADKGSCVIFFDESKGDKGEWLALPYIAQDGYDVYGDPVPAKAYGYNNYNFNVDPNKSVLIYNNMTKTPEIETIQMFAERLYRKSRIIDINANAHKTPVLIRATDRTRHSVLQVFKKYDSGEPYIFGDKDLDINSSLEVLNLVSTNSFVADRINTLKLQDMSEVMSFYGVTSSMDNKKERLITDEVDQQSGETNANIYSRLYMRQQAMDKLSRLTGQKCSVRFRSRTMTQEGVISDNEQLHHDSEDNLQ